MEKFEANKAPLSKEEAQKEAGMVRAQMAMNPESGKLESWRDATAQDYDQALAALEELKTLAEQEPASRKIFGVLGRLSVTAAEMVMYIIKDSSSARSPEWHDPRYWGSDEERNAAIEDARLRKVGTDEIDARFWNTWEARRAAVENASYKLRKLEKEGKRFDKAE
jgi:hypothetical protein